MRVTEAIREALRLDGRPEGRTSVKGVAERMGVSADAIEWTLRRHRQAVERDVGAALALLADDLVWA